MTSGNGITKNSTRVYSGDANAKGRKQAAACFQGVAPARTEFEHWGTSVIFHSSAVHRFCFAVQENVHSTFYISIFAVKICILQKPKNRYVEMDMEMLFYTSVVTRHAHKRSEN